MASELNCMIVDDDPIFRQYISKQIKETNGLKLVTEAESAAKALDLLEEHEVDIIFLDVQMPEMDGLEATELILNEVDKNAYIVAMTANVLSEDRDKCLEAGMVEFLGKPVLNDTLIQKLDSFLKNRAGLQKAS
jgi:CheY-like chemotaxis protein